jgi:hypothetical protein
VSAIQYFSPVIFARIGISANKTLLSQDINSIHGELAQFIFFLLIDGVGRRLLQIWGNLACVVAFITGAALLAGYPPTNSNNAAHWAFIVASTWVFNFCSGEPPFFVSITVHLLKANQRFRYNVLDHSSRDFQHRDSCKGDIFRNYGILRVQHHD